MNAWDSLMKLRLSVLHKKLKFQKERLEMKLNFILHSQVRTKLQLVKNFCHKVDDVCVY